MSDRKDWKRWRITYLPSSLLPGPCEWVYEGTRADIDEWFLKNRVCKFCIADMDGVDPRHESPWSTGCGAEHDLEEIEQ